MDREKLIEIEDNIPDCVFDEIWVDVDKEAVEDLLKTEYPDIEYTVEDIKDIMDYVNDRLKEIRLEQKDSEISELRDNIGYAISDCAEHLSNEEIGILLVSLANEYFEYY